MSLELVVGRCYRAKRPANSQGLVNDRQIKWIGTVEVQYDGPAVANGRHYPRVTKDKFLEWAAADVTDTLPVGAWLPWGALPDARSAVKKK